MHRFTTDRPSPPIAAMIRSPLLLAFAVSLSASVTLAGDFASDWDNQHDRVWIGPQYWANPLEDWRLNGGRLECTTPAPGRSVHLLTHQLGEQDGNFEMSVVLGLFSSPDRQGGGQGGSAGFEYGIKSELGDYRSSLIFGGGYRAVLTSDGNVLVGTGRGTPGTVQPGKREVIREKLATTGIRLRLIGEPSDEGYSVACRIHDAETDELISVAGISSGLPASLSGNLALITNPQFARGPNSQGGRPQAKFWFRDWKVTGTKLVENSDHAFGPILYSMYTLSRGTMTMTAQMPPMGAADEKSVILQVPEDVAKSILAVPGVETTVSPADGNDSAIPWAPIARATIDPLSCTAHFRISDWPDTKDVPYRLVYAMQTTNGKQIEHEYRGTVRKDPVDQPEISVAGFTGHQHTAFPNELLVSNVAKHDPDLLFFSGDQIYENAGGFGIIREPVDRACLNYLRKMWLWGWSFRDVLKDRPSFVLPDDHDVYQGNIWGEGGKPVPGGIQDHDQGGFAEPPDFVNAVFRTQCGHHPPVYDPTPKLQGIDCFYGDCVYGRISFAILEDRYFKSGPAGKVNTWGGRADHVKDPAFDTRSLDKQGLILLGERQLKFLDDWAADWTGADMKCVCSQTIFANVANYHGENQEYIYGDLDSNGWPQIGRNKAVEAMRRGFAFHYTGDQHLPSIIQYGVDDWRDAGFSFCVPSTAAGYPRSWRPDEEGREVRNRPAPGLPNTGDYYDSFGNHVTVYAIANPAKMNRKPVLELLHDKSSGYGIVRFDKPDRTITMECWKLIFDAADPQPEDQFTGWPKTIGMLDNYARKPTGYLPTINVQGMTDPVVQVVDEGSNEIVYTLRISGSSFRPPVFSEGPFTVRVGELGAQEKSFSGVVPATDDSRTLDAALP
jgi:alkaline phosphatase D